MNIDVDNLSGASSSSRHRYVEVFLYSENAGKVKFKKSFAMGGQDDIDPALEAEAAQISPDQIATEVRQYMAQEGKGELLLSMLGVALSPAARLYLRKSDRGVKRFLAQYPDEFVISGEKGRERITYMQRHGSQHINGLSVGNLSLSKVADTNPLAEHNTQLDADRLDVPPTPMIWGSPEVDRDLRPTITPSCFKTPSNWGTPDVNQGGSKLDIAGMFTENPGQLPSMWLPFQVNCPPPPDPRFASQAVKPVETQAAETPMVRLRGLPFDATTQDVCSFFAQHGVVDRVADGVGAIQIVSKSNGKPSGNALVQLRKAQDVVIVQRALHLSNLGTRYIEVLPHKPIESDAPAPNLQADSVDQVQLRSAPPLMAGATLYSDAWFLSQVAVAVAQCPPEPETLNSCNPSFQLMAQESCRQVHGLCV